MRGGRTKAERAEQPDIWRLEIAILAILAILALDTLDSFGLPSGADQRGRALTSRLIGEVADLGRRSGQESVAVALITDGTLNAWETGPPPPYQRQADLILRLAAAQPKAIFLDFVYRFPRESPEALGYLGFAIDAAAEAGVPVFLGPISDRPELTPLSGAGQVDLGFVVENPDEYPMRGRTGRPTAAAALYAAFCRDAGERCDPQFLRAVTSGEAAPLALQWRPRAPPQSYLFWPPEELERCAFAVDALSERAVSTANLIWREATRGLRNEADPSETACFPHLAAPAALLMSDQVSDEHLAAFAKDRVVMVGSAYLGSADETVAPGFGRIPGVFQHAMALDNLITFGDEYRRNPPDLFFELGVDDLAEAALSVLLLAFGSWALHRVVRRAPRPGEPAFDAETWRTRVVAPAAGLYGFAAIAVLSPFVAGYIVAALLDWAPANAIGVVLTVFGVGSIVLQRGVIARLREVGVLGPLGWGLGAAAATGIVGALAVSALASGQSFVVLVAASVAIALLAVAVGALVVAARRPRSAP